MMSWCAVIRFHFIFCIKKRRFCLGISHCHMLLSRVAVVTWSLSVTMLFSRDLISVFRLFVVLLLRVGLATHKHWSEIVGLCLCFESCCIQEWDISYYVFVMLSHNMTRKPCYCKETAWCNLLSTPPIFHLQNDSLAVDRCFSAVPGSEDPSVTLP